jgi:ABC-2 type transport system ATP-binding protein
MTKAVIETVDLGKVHFSSFLRKRFQALDQLSLTVNDGETFGLLGLNGAGKTTTIKLLLGLLRPTSGKVKVLGHNAGDAQALGKIGFLPEAPYFYSYLTALEFLDFSGRLFNMKAKLRKERAQELLELVGLSDAAKRPIGKFSKGMMQRLGIAQSLLNDPELIFWDEPTSGLDPIGRRDVRTILHSLKDRGKTIFFNSHLLPDVSEVCDRIGILHRGKLIYEGKVADITQGGNYLKLEDFFLTSIQEAEANYKKGNSK